MAVSAIWLCCLATRETAGNPFLVAKQPIFKAFCDFGGAKMACNGLKMGSFHLFRHPTWSRIIFRKTHF